MKWLAASSISTTLEMYTVLAICPLFLVPGRRIIFLVNPSAWRDVPLSEHDDSMTYETLTSRIPGF